MSKSDSVDILSVEDNENTRFLLRHLLEDRFNVIVVPGIEDALEVFRSKSFDLLLLDINLGTEKNGVDLLHMIRAREQEGHVPAIALTAYAMPADRERYLSEGFDEYIGKPFTRSELTETIDRTLSSTLKKA